MICILFSCVIFTILHLAESLPHRQHIISTVLVNSSESQCFYIFNNSVQQFQQDLQYVVNRFNL